MINALLVEGYKSLLSTDWLETKGLNLLVGSNASGKSSLLQALLLLRQSSSASGSLRSLRLSGELYEGGTAIDILNPEANHSVNFGFRQNETENLYRFFFDRDSAKKRKLIGEHEYTLPSVLADRTGRFAYLNAERIGPRVWYPLPSEEIDLAGQVGKHGQYTAALLARSGQAVNPQGAYSKQIMPGWDETIAHKISSLPQKLDGLDIQADLVSSAGRIDLISNYILGWIIPNSSFIATEEESIDAAPLKFIRDSTATKVETRATHVGFGLAYLLPVIVAALSLDRQGLLIVENPEAHLHPFGQSRIGAFLAMVAALGHQVFVETHSDHVVNGVRLAIKLGELSHDNALFNYFENSPDGAHTSITQIASDEEGYLDSWPKGFFDQIENDLARI